MPKISLYRRGYCLEHKRKSLPEHKGGGKRGKLNGKPSAASFRRLRAWCIRHDISAECWGITLTIPALQIIDVESFKNLHHKLCVWCNDNNTPLVWRVELQKRGQPHLHCVLFGSVELAMRLLSHWYRLLQSLPQVWSVEAVENKKDDLVLVNRAFVRGSAHAVDLQKLSGDFRAWRYLVAHMSKGKVEQLGWAGRNWGVCNRRLFSVVQAEEYELLDFEFYALRRWVRRLRIGAKPLDRPCKRFRRVAFRGRAFSLGNPDIIRQMYMFIVECERITGGDESAVRNSGACRFNWLYSNFGLTFLSSFPQGYDDYFFDSFKKDVSKVLQDLLQTHLKFMIYYKVYCFKSLDCASLSPKGRKF